MRNWFLLLLAAYFSIHVVIRILVSPSLDYDEAEQAFFLQNLAIGYNAQPPLYTWLQALMTWLVGTNIFAFALLKNILIFLIYFFVYRTARLVLSRTVSVGATLALALFPQILWEYQRDLTHTVLLTTTVSASWFLLLRYVLTAVNGTRGEIILFALGFGVTVALGMMAKYSFLLHLACLLGAAVLQRECRSIISWRIVLAIAILVILLLFPHGYWLLENFSQISSELGRKFQGSPEHQNSHSFVILMQSIVTACGVFVMISIIGSRMKGCPEGETTSSRGPGTTFVYRILRSYFILMAIALMFLTIAFSVRGIKERWLQPFLIMLPLFVMVYFNNYQRSVLLSRMWKKIAVTLLPLCLIFIPSATILSPHVNKTSRLNIPYKKLVSAISIDFPGATQILIIDSRLETQIAGNLWFAAASGPGWRTYTSLAQVPREDHSKLFRLRVAESEKDVTSKRSKIYGFSSLYGGSRARMYFWELIPPDSSRVMLGGFE